MATFLDLPQELRDDILETAIYAVESPPSPEAAQLDRSEIPKGSSSFDGTRRVRYSAKAPVPTAAALLQVSQAVNSQTQRILRRGGIVYNLDCLFLNESCFYPTWLNIPLFSTHVETVNVTFRISGIKSKDEGWSAFRGGDGGPPEIVWALHKLLEDFLIYGPLVPIYTLRARSRNIILHNLCIKIVSDDPSSQMGDSRRESMIWQSRHDRHRAEFLSRRFPDEDCTDRGLQMNPKFLGSYVFGYLRSVVSMSYHTSAHGTLPCRQLGRVIEVTESGEYEEKLDVNTTLQEMRGAPAADSQLDTTEIFGHVDGHCRVLTMWNWKYDTFLRRSAQGLLHIPFEEMGWPALRQIQGWRALRAELGPKWGRPAEGEPPDPRDGHSEGCLCHETALERRLQQIQTT